MPYDEKLAQRIRKALHGKRQLSERKMFGGIAFLHRGHMFCGVLRDNLVVRVGPERGSQMLPHPHVLPMDFTGKVMKGYLYVNPKGTSSTKSLNRWLEEALAFVRGLPPKAALKKTSAF